LLATSHPDTESDAMIGLTAKNESETIVGQTVFWKITKKAEYYNVKNDAALCQPRKTLT